MSEQEKRCSAYLRTWKKRKRCSYKAVNNGRCRRHQEKTAQREATQPAIEGDVVERVARAMWDSVPSYGDVTFDEARDVFIDSKEWQDIISQYLIMSHAAISAMQPAIEKAAAEERARCVALAKDNMRLTRADLIKAIEQGGE